MVGREGLEPSYPCGHGILSPARLPIPPPALVGTDVSASVNFVVAPLFYQRVRGSLYNKA